MLYTATGSTADGSWTYAIGGSGSSKPANASDPTSDGFGSFGINVNNGQSQPKNLNINLYNYNSTLYAGTSVDNLRFTTSGAELWKATGPATGLTWTKVTGNGFGDTNICQFESYTVFNNTLYLVASDAVYSNFIGEILPGSTGAKIYRIPIPPGCGNGVIDQGEQCETNADCIAVLGQGSTCSNCQCEAPTLIELAGFEARGAWGRVILSWSTASEKDNAGFNIYRAETENGAYEKINAAIIPARGSETAGASYRFVDWSAEKGKAYYYKLEDVDTTGIATQHGPVSATAKTLYMMVLGK
jgi:hypothetical protein